MNDDEHPLVQELASLRNALAHYQHEAHASGLKLQRLSLDTSTALARLHSVESEKARLENELAVYRAHPISSATSKDASTVHRELSLALRHLSDKLDATDETLLQRNQELAVAHADRDRSKRTADNAFALAARLRAELEAERATERELRSRAKAAEEQRNMSDLALTEYADLVRSLEGRKSHSGSEISMNGLTSARAGLQRLLAESNVDTEKLYSEVGRLHGLLETSQASLEAERQASSGSARELARAQLELQRLRSDDRAAAKMVSRYMSFSESVTKNLHSTMENLRKRHDITLTNTLERLRETEERLAIERSHSEKLRQALDELTEDISREAYGRRREISLRLAILGREERVSERLRRWILKARESARKSESLCGTCAPLLTSLIEGAESIQGRLDFSVADATASGSEARFAAVLSGVASLSSELQRETDRRLLLEHRSVDDGGEGTITSASSATKASATLPSSITSPLLVVASNPQGMALEDSSSAEGTYTKAGELEDSPASGGQAESLEATVSLPLISEILPNERHAEQSGETTRASSLLSEALKSQDEIAVQLAESSEEVRDIESSTSDAATDDSAFASHSDIAEERVPAATDGLSETNENSEEAVRGVSCVDRNTLPFLPAGELSKFVSQSELDDEPKPADQVEAEEAPALDPALQELVYKLGTVEDRYNGLQRSFRECHASLTQLQSDIDVLEDSIGKQRLKVAVQRVDDYCEDARVELEMRVTDEERIAKGYETLLSVSGALPDGENGEAILRQAQDFLDYNDPIMRKPLDVLLHKLEDLEHDIAKLKYAMYELKDGDSASPGVHVAPEPPSSPGGWASWTTILSHSRPSSPAPATFGSVVTSPRLRHSTSFQRQISEQGGQGPFASMGLRIPMPSTDVSAGSIAAANEPRSKFATRPRVSSGVYSVGLGGGLGTAGPFGMSSRKATYTLSDSSNPPSPGLQVAQAPASPSQPVPEPVDEEVE